MSTQRHALKRRTRKGERGIALIFATFCIAALLVAIAGALVTGSANARASVNYTAASQAHFGAPCGYIGQGGTIPLMNMLSEGFPNAQMMVCGVLGPKSNAHGPNEFLHVPYAKKLTAAVAQVIAGMAQHQAAATTAETAS